MSDVWCYEVVMFQGKDSDGHCIFRGDSLEECKAFAKQETESFKGFIANGFPQGSAPEFAVVVYYADQSSEILED